jgi:hypothetical protein
LAHSDQLFMSFTIQWTVNFQIRRLRIHLHTISPSHSSPEGGNLRRPRSPSSVGPIVVCFRLDSATPLAKSTRGMGTWCRGTAAHKGNAPAHHGAGPHSRRRLCKPRAGAFEGSAVWGSWAVPLRCIGPTRIGPMP